jgi:hypothetical protein
VCKIELSWRIDRGETSRLYTGKPEATKRDLELKEVNNGR